MVELSTARLNPLVDPQLHAWSWEIPVYLFLGGLVAGLMVYSGLALLRQARGETPHRFFTVQAPLWAFILMNIGMGALFLDLTHKLHVWAVYITFQPASPMSWGSWILLAVYGALGGVSLETIERSPDQVPPLPRSQVTLRCNKCGRVARYIAGAA